MVEQATPSQPAFDSRGGSSGGGLPERLHPALFPQRRGDGCLRRNKKKRDGKNDCGGRVRLAVLRTLKELVVCPDGCKIKLHNNSEGKGCGRGRNVRISPRRSCLGGVSSVTLGRHHDKRTNMALFSWSVFFSDLQIPQRKEIRAGLQKH